MIQHGAAPEVQIIDQLRFIVTTDPFFDWEGDRKLVAHSFQLVLEEKLN